MDCIECASCHIVLKVEMTNADILWWMVYFDLQTDGMTATSICRQNVHNSALLCLHLTQVLRSQLLLFVHIMCNGYCTFSKWDRTELFNISQLGPRRRRLVGDVASACAWLTVDCVGDKGYEGGARETCGAFRVVYLYIADVNNISCIYNCGRSSVIARGRILRILRSAYESTPQTLDSLLALSQVSTGTNRVPTGGSAETQSSLFPKLIQLTELYTILIFRSTHWNAAARTNRHIK